ncbi:MAG: hypothetical protein IT553_04435 [Sphingomonadaceae bacterium]|nr:hypothetical protein [Sphingomonadaceae bacterium]
MALSPRIGRRQAAQDERQRDTLHTGFLAYANFRWLKILAVICAIAILSYLLIDITPRHNGGSWYGYTLGTIGALLILWLTLLGVRKRAMTAGGWSLKAWVSAHVYLGLSLIVIATLHTGFQLGWNVHTLAWVLMMLVIASGIWGISVYATLPAALSNNRDERTQAQMLDDIRSLDRQIHEAAQPLPPQEAAIAIASLDQDPFAGSLWSRLSGRYPKCATAAALAQLRYGEDDAAMEKLSGLLNRKNAALGRLRRHLKLKALLEIWLYIHVPLTFALIAALSAHIISVFFYW